MDTVAILQAAMKEPFDMRKVLDAQDWLENTIDAMVDFSKDVRVEAEVSALQAGAFIFVVYAPVGLVGQLIGKQGAIAKSLRTLLRGRGAVDGVRYGLDIRQGVPVNLADVSIGQWAESYARPLDVGVRPPKPGDVVHTEDGPLRVGVAGVKTLSEAEE